MDTPPTRIVQTTLPQLIHVLHTESEPFRSALDQGVLDKAGLTAEDLQDMNPEKGARLQAALAAVNHLDIVTAYIKEHPGVAARVIMPTVYLAGASYTAQELDLTDDVVQGVVV